MPNPTRRALLIALALLPLPLGVARDDAPAPAAPVTVVLVRHAEKASDGQDPPLTEAGEARAAALVSLLRNADVTHLFASPYARTQQTLAPLSALLGLEVGTREAGDAAGWAAALDALPPGSTAVVAGHSNTVPGIAAALGAPIAGLEEHPTYGPMLGHDEYDRLFVVTLPASEDAAAKLLELRYGDDGLGDSQPR